MTSLAPPKPIARGPAPVRPMTIHFEARTLVVLLACMAGLWLIWRLWAILLVLVVALILVQFKARRPVQTPTNS